MRSPTVRAVPAGFVAAVPDAVAGAGLQVSLDGADHGFGPAGCAEGLRAARCHSSHRPWSPAGEADAGLFSELSQVALLPWCRPIRHGVGVVARHDRAREPGGRANARANSPACRARRSDREPGGSGRGGLTDRRAACLALTPPPPRPRCRDEQQQARAGASRRSCRSSLAAASGAAPETTASRLLAALSTVFGLAPA